MKIKAWGETDVGLKRAMNQDSILLDVDLGLYVVADGMGGHKGGEVASSIAVKTAKEILLSEVKKKELSPRDILLKIYREASARIHYKSSVESQDLEGMGTTMVMTFFCNGEVYVGNVGDSRCYLFHNNNLWQLTEDHSLVNEQLKAGVISEDDVGLIIGRNVITRSVGYEKDVRVDVFQRKLAKGEKLLLCSDGLCGQVSDALIEDICRKTKGKGTVTRCVDEAKKAGGDDNISVVYIEVY